MGISRSGTIVVAYLMRKCGMTFEDALILSRKYRSCIGPNDGFCEQLEQYEKQLRKPADRAVISGENVLNVVVTDTPDSSLEQHS